MKAREVIQKLNRDGWKQIRQKGSHRIFEHPTKPGLVVVPDHAGVDLHGGDTREECERMIREAIELYVETMRDLGRALPASSSEAGVVEIAA